MKKRRLLVGLVAGGCALGMLLPRRALAEVSDADFNALKETVQKLTEQVRSLQQTNLMVQQAHEKDMEKIQQLQETACPNTPISHEYGAEDHRSGTDATDSEGAD